MSHRPRLLHSARPLSGKVDVDWAWHLAFIYWGAKKSKKTEENSEKGQDLKLESLGRFPTWELRP